MMMWPYDEIVPREASPISHAYNKVEQMKGYFVTLQNDTSKDEYSLIEKFRAERGIKFHGKVTSLSSF